MHLDRQRPTLFIAETMKWGTRFTNTVLHLRLTLKVSNFSAYVPVEL